MILTTDLALLAGAGAVVGLLVGSFLNVVIHRVPLGLSVVNPPSACPRCGHRIRARENVPVVSWLLLRGRCSGCQGRISARYPAVEAGTGLLFGAVTALVGPSWELPAYLYLSALVVCLTLIDLDVRRLPDTIVKPAYPVTLLLLLVPAWIGGEWSSLFRAAIAGVVLWAVYALLFLIWPGGMGLGDVKLAGVLGAYLGWWGWSALAVGGFAAFLLGGVVGVALVVRGAGRKTKIPFGPYMLAGAMLALFVGAPVAQWYLNLVGLPAAG
ncbi:prepilin peptidase [Kineococcus sp. GCM10028916]|uniref:prepilin peptidase n=1 Tax=Kineococcus sp. GCM10028916 TaxID=3273394 RepID=UPI00362DC2F0